ncbi:MAG: cytochrome c biogenesis protein CcsA [Acidimicrobiales bacterium]
MAGQLLLWLAVGCAVASLTLAALRRGRQPVLDTGAAPWPIDTWLLIAASGLLWAAVAYLSRAIMALDTSFVYVAEQTRPGMSLPLRFSALWSGAEGSLLLFAAICSTVFPIGHRTAPRWQRIGVGVVAAGLGLAVLGGADPFPRLDLPPLAGAGMAPILEHFAMVIHPPLLYAGMALALVPALVRQPQRAHRFALASLVVLTAALGFGSAWAYVELGWGGWWAWDPIENVALIVWLMLAAGLHWQPLDRRRTTGTGPLNAVVIWALCWPAVLGGAALTRTSLRTSVHAFADAAALSVWLWPLVALGSLGAGLRIIEWWHSSRAGSASSQPSAQLDERAVDRIRRLPLWILMGAGFVVAAGTYRPFIGGDGTAGWFYSRTLYPLAIVGALLIGLVPLWRRSGTGPGPGLDPTQGRGSWFDGFPARAVVRFGLPGAATLGLGALLGGWRQWFQLVLAAALGFGVALVLSSGRGGTARLAGHLGVLLVLFGALAGTGSTESVVRLAAGESAVVDGHTVMLISTEIVSEEPLRAAALVRVDGSYELQPSVSVYADRNLRLPEVSTRTRPWLDSQAILRDVDPEAGALITVLFRPWNQLVWWGLALLALAAVLAMAGHPAPAPGRPTVVDRAGAGELLRR